MAMKVKGITIELSADATGIESALRDVNKSLSATQKDLTAVTRALELDPSNVELVEQKSRLLGKAVDDTRKKLEALKEAQENISAEDSDDAQRQYDALTREISKTNVELDKLSQEQSEFDQEMDQGKEKSSDFASGIEKIGSAADTVAQKTAGLSAAAAGALVAMVGLVKQSADSAAGWTETANEIGFTAEGVQRLQYASAGVGVEMNDITGAVKNMNNNLEDNESAFKRIGVRVRDNNGEYKSSERIFYDTVGALGKIEDSTERNQRATAIFGENASKIAPAFEDGGRALRAMAEEAESSGTIVSDEDVQKLNKFNNQLEATKVMLASAFANVGASALTALAPAFEAVANAARMFGYVLGSLPPELLTVIAVVLLIVAAISPIAKIVSGITSAVGAFVKVIPAVVTGLQLIGQAMTAAFASNPYAVMILAIVAALAVLGAALYMNWDEISAGAEGAFEGAKEAVSGATDKIKNVLDSFAGAARKIFQSAASAVESFIDAIQELENKVRDKVDKITGAIKQLKEAFSGLGGKLKSSVGNLGDIFGNVGGDAGSVGSRIMHAFAGGITSAIGAVRAAIQQLSAAIEGLWAAMTGRAKAAGQQTANAYADGMSSGRQPTLPGGNFLGGAGPNSAGPANANSGGGFFGSGNGGSELLGAINDLNNNITRLGRQTEATNVNVTLTGSAANIFDTVRVQNNILETATGYHALA